jgi:hypothetical protein
MAHTSPTRALQTATCMHENLMRTLTDDYRDCYLLISITLESLKGKIDRK